MCNRQTYILTNEKQLHREAAFRGGVIVYEKDVL